MPLNVSQNNAVNQWISRMREEGFLLPDRRSLAGNTRYLIISCGGIGAEALFAVKKAFETALPQEQLAERVRFLAIDTDHYSQKQIKQIISPDGMARMIEVDALTTEQFILLSGTKARMAADRAGDTSQWISPELLDHLRYNHMLLDGYGASGVRQLGRLYLYADAHVITERIRCLAAQLTNGNPYSLQVFFLTGIAGGTGAGMVIDLPYLIRNALESMPGLAVPGLVTYGGFILLPPTCNSTRPDAIEHGNRNGYAALKEIDYYMTLAQRGERYSFTYFSGMPVTSEKNLFDSCYLLDGSMGNVICQNPRAAAIRHLSQSLLDMVTSEFHIGGAMIPTSEYLTQAGFPANVTVANYSVNYAPRDAGYVYSTLGMEEFAMPSDQIKAYVAKQMYDRIYHMSHKVDDVAAEDVRRFLQNVLKRGVKSMGDTVLSMKDETANWFADLDGYKRGPYFASSLLGAVAEEARLQHNKLKIMRICMASDQELDNIEKYAFHLRNNFCDICAAAMDGLKDLLDEQYGKVVQATPKGKFYSFIPRVMGSGWSGDSVIRYLDGLVNNASLRNVYLPLFQEMMEKFEAWTALACDKDSALAAKTMREFWNNQLDNLVNATFEDLLLKYYSANPDACYSPNNHAQTRQYLQAAARGVFAHLLGRADTAAPMASFTTDGLCPENFNSRSILIVPECAPNLYAELCNVAANSHLMCSVEVHLGTARDRVTCYRFYSSAPAFKLNWVCNAEEDYERSVLSMAGVGLHTSETVDGIRWLVFPNLLPRSSRDHLPRFQYVNGREVVLANYAADLFRNSQTLGLVSNVILAAPCHRIKVLPAEYLPGAELAGDIFQTPSRPNEHREALMAAVDRCASELHAILGFRTNFATPTEISQILSGAGVGFVIHDLFFPDSVLTVGPMDRMPEDWSEYLAGCMLRRKPQLMLRTEQTIMVMQKLLDKIYTAEA